MEAGTRRELGLDQSDPRDLDGRMRDLTDEEVHTVIH
jgi:hypothetical protein